MFLSESEILLYDFDHTTMGAVSEGSSYTLKNGGPTCDNTHYNATPCIEVPK